jgi:hypothetical protein
MTDAKAGLHRWAPGTSCDVRDPAGVRLVGIAVHRRQRRPCMPGFEADRRAPLGLREIDGGTIGIEGVRSTLFNVGLY